MLLDLPSPVVFNRSRSSEHFLATSFASTDRSTHFHPSSILSHDDTIHINGIKPQIQKSVLVFLLQVNKAECPLMDGSMDMNKT